ncbi:MULTISPECIES: GNAT family N-acetyltransferase [Paenibacillus]|uniref:GNAT family N-acetyltransferase n=1 Tax=Paenibacillus campinasensis TaxID=66347 RepID=A0A268EU45_9BACL|nr:GNAT family N-acetyltransferase [Paenibacillus campinasensis]MUG67443.1 GNAT family N-acetyltransferase [Paenibacillus campinasensis]PAD76621.1 GNAT family N-acetyltransferase [Paenibacillus campinasensis]
MIRPYRADDLPEVVALWNQEAVKHHYQRLTNESFTRTFIKQPYYDPACVLVAYEDDELVGFAAGCTGDDLPLGEAAGYITCVWVKEGSGPQLVDQLVGRLEQRFVQLGKIQAEVLFFNPVKLGWHMPSEPRHEHNNAPGISKDLPLYRCLVQRGYVDRATQCGMYLKLGQFNVPGDIIAKEQRAAEKGYTVVRFDSAVHQDLNGLLAALGNPQWQHEIIEAAAAGVPLLVAALDHQCVGFAGPIIRQTNGRAYFSGIGVHPEHEGHGLGSVLFFRMVEAFQAAGCEYSTLFTGSNNPAIRIYERAGFTIEKQFSILRKERLACVNSKRS